MSDKCVNVALFADQVGGQWPSPSTQLRFLLPWRNDVCLLDGETLRDLSIEALTSTVDVAVFQRLEIASAANQSIARHLVKADIPIILDLDDDFLALADLSDHEAQLMSASAQERFLAGLAMSDAIWTASASMTERYKEFGSELTIRETLPPPLPKAGPANAERLKVLYFGTQTHHRDWALVEDVIAELVAENLIHCTLIGVNPAFVPPGVRNVQVEPRAISRYVSFMRFVAQQGPFDVGIAPLRPDVFSRGKSSLKLFEYLELGLLPVGSPVGPYEWLKDVDPHLAPSSSREWRQSLLRIIAQTPQQREEARLQVEIAVGLKERRRIQIIEDVRRLRGLVQPSGGVAVRKS